MAQDRKWYSSVNFNLAADKAKTDAYGLFTCSAEPAKPQRHGGRTQSARHHEQRPPGSDHRREESARSYVDE